MPTTYAIIKGNQYFDATLYTGTGSTLAVTNAGGFQPDLVWLKNMSSSAFHSLWDSVRGRSAGGLATNDTMAEQSSTAGNDFVSFNSNGFTVGTNQNWNVDTNAASYVGWQWKANGAAVSNTAGSITSSVSANTTSGFSVVTYTGTGANATVGHGLSVAPQWVVVKNRQTAGTSWKVYHIGLTSAAYALEMETTGAQASTPACWNSTAPTSTVVNLGSNAGVNESSKTHVMYCFAPVVGYSKFGYYVGNGSSDGPFVYTGFKPKFIITKNISGTGNWQINDTSRDTYNVAGLDLYANSSSAQSDDRPLMDILSNGFKLRNTYTGINTSGSTYIYMAFAEMPTKYANAR